MADDVLTRNENDELAVRVVSTNGDTNTNPNDVYTRDENGKLCVRVTGGGDQHNLGYFATLQALQEAHPTAEAGDWAIVGATDTVWIWDTDTSAWVDSDQKGQVTSVNNQTGAVVLTASDVGAATTAQGTKADTAVQPSDLATVATTGDYDDLTNKPTIPAAQVNSDWDAVSGVAQILNKPTLGTMAAESASDYTKTANLATVATTGAYSDLSGTPTIPEATQVSTMPTAGVSELGKIYQFTGTTDANYTNGYFYKCVSDGQNPATYSWTRVDAQPAPVIPDPLPSQTGNAGKFLTTDGTDASWEKGFKNLSTNNYGIAICWGNTSSISSWSSYNILIGSSSVIDSHSVQIGNDTRGGSYSISIGRSADTTNSTGSIAIGDSATAHTTMSNIPAIAIGTSAETLGDRAIAIGNGAKAKADYAIQIGGWLNPSTSTWDINTSANTVKFANNNGNYEIMSADGTVPADRLTHAINKYSTMPTASSSNEGWIVQFTGTTDSTYTHGYIYECKAQGTNPETYAWEAVSVQAGGSSLPSQTGNAGKFLTTDGTDASWGSALVNVDTTHSDTLVIGTGAGGDRNTVLGIGAGSYGGTDNTVVGAKAQGRYKSTVIGANIQNSSAQNMVAIGSGNSAQFTGNLDDNSFNWVLSGTVYKLMSSDGTIPEARLADTTNAQQGDVLTLDVNGDAVWQAGSGGGLPSQSGQSGKFLTTDGTNASWATISAGGAVSATATLAVNDWSSNTQTINVTGVTASNNVIVAAAPASQADYTSAGILCTAQGAGTLTFTCTTTPSSAITVNVLII